MGRLYIYLHENHKNRPNVGKDSLHGSYGCPKNIKHFGGNLEVDPVPVCAIVKSHPLMNGFFHKGCLIWL